MSEETGFGKRVDAAKATPIGTLRIASRDPLVYRGIMAIAFAVLLAIGFQVRGTLMQVAIPIGLIFYVFTQLWELWRKRSVEAASPRMWISLTVALGIAVFFLIAPKATLLVTALAIAAAFALSGISNVVDAWRHRTEHEQWQWMLVKGLFLIFFAVLIAMFPANMLTFAFVTMLIVWIAGGVISILHGLRHDEEVAAKMDPSAMVMGWLSHREYSSEDRHALVGTLFFEGPDFQKRISRFSALMAFSVIIATLGVLQDSTAVVIGAMLIAPLMNPIMALAASIVMGWPKRAMNSFVIIALAVLGGILLAMVVALFAPVVGDAMQSSQVQSRISPTLLDLMVALTAGAAGAFAMSRPDVSDSLPGVAIAVALVPPLGVVGVTLAAGDWGAAAGSFLLFLTNFVSIVLAGSITFILVGFSPLFRLKQKGSQIRVALGMFGILALMIAIPLSITGQQLYTDAQTQHIAGEVLTTWLDDAGVGHDLDKVIVSGDEIQVVVGITGDDLPPIDEYAQAVAEEGVTPPFTITVSWVPVHEESSRYETETVEWDGFNEL